MSSRSRLGSLSGCSPSQVMLLDLAILLMLASSLASSAMIPALCNMGCSCVTHEEDDTVSTLACRDIGFTAIPNLRMFPNLTQL